MPKVIDTTGLEDKKSYCASDSKLLPGTSNTSSATTSFVLIKIKNVAKNATNKTIRDAVFFIISSSVISQTTLIAHNTLRIYITFYYIL
ncbi:hypothetical protein SDC9_112339 [bioreactor metagenome]|uniref:Uncharacterized protein n=1 Tax=bioreactor metagenome TaxID=1076179 RepID=A0A645BQD3_9ZZZZ